MPRSINNVDLNLVINYLIPNLYGGILSQDGDTPLTLKGIRVHHAFDHLLILTENTSLFEQTID